MTIPGASISLNNNGTIIGMGGWGNTENGSNAGHVRVYEWREYTQTDEDDSIYRHQDTIQGSNQVEPKPLIATETIATSPRKEKIIGHKEDMILMLKIQMIKVVKCIFKAKVIF